MTSEDFRKGLIKWNAAPLLVVAFLCWMAWTLVEYYKHVACKIDPTSQGALFIFLGGIVGILYKIYDSMQADRKKNLEET